MTKLEEILSKVSKKTKMGYSYLFPQGIKEYLVEYKEKIIFNNETIKIPCQQEYFSYSSIYGDKNEHMSSYLSSCAGCFFCGGMKTIGEFTAPICAAKQLELIWKNLSAEEKENVIYFLAYIYDLRIERE